MHSSRWSELALCGTFRTILLKNSLTPETARKTRILFLQVVFGKSPVLRFRLQCLRQSPGQSRRTDIAQTNSCFDLFRNFGIEACSSDADVSRGISLQKFQQFQTYIRQFVTAGEAASILACSPTQLMQLQKAGLLAQRQMEPGVFRLHRRDLVSFLEPITDLPVVATTGTARSLWKTYNYVKCSIADIYRLIRDGRLASACRSPGPAGLSLVLVEPEEVRQHLNLQIPDDPHGARVARRLRTNQHTLHYLADRELLSLSRRRHPKTRNVRWYVERRSLEHFEKEFVTIGVLAGQLGELPGPLAKRLDLLGINPTYSAAGISRSYRRAAIRELLTQSRRRQCLPETDA